MESRISRTLAKPAVPERTSSRSPTKRVVESPPEQQQDLIDSLKREREESNKEAKEARKRVKLSISFDADYWARRGEVTKHEIRSTRLTRRISMASMQDQTMDDFSQTEHGKRLLQQERSLALERSLYEKQREHMSKSSPGGHTLRRAFAERFIGATNGLGSRNSPGPRSSSKQSNLRAELIRKMKLEHPNEAKVHLWCPVTKEYWHPSSMQAGHFYPWKYGQTNMDAIFGPMGDSTGGSELMKAENAILWSQEAEERFSKRLFVIVPNVPDNPDRSQVASWEATPVRDYRIRIIAPENKLMSGEVHSSLNSQKIWRDLDGTKVEFRSEWRPRARYIYFAYCRAVLAESFAGKHLKASRDNELGIRYWGTRGRYMRRSVLWGFVETLGLGYEYLLEGAIEEDGAEADLTGVAVANYTIKEALRGDDDNEEDEEEEEEEEGSEDEEGDGSEDEEGEGSEDDGRE